MGIHIGVVTFAGDRYRDSEDYHDWWDSIRYAGDREFAEWLLSEQNAIRKHYPNELRWETEYLRPSDLDKAEQWVRENIPWNENQRRLMDVLQRMRADPTLWFDFSY